jgi:hypothetical protein
MNERERLYHLCFVGNVTSQTYCSARTLGARRISGLFCRFAILIQNGHPVTPPGAKQCGRSTDTTAAPGNDDEPAR